MSAVANLSALSNYFKRVYGLAEKRASMVKKNKTLSLMERDDSKLMSNDGFYVTVKTFQARSAAGTYEYGSRDYSVSQSFRWFVDGPKALYGSISIDNLTLRKNKSGASLIDVKKTEMEEVSQGFLTRLEHQLWSDGSGALAQVTVSGSDPTFTCTCQTVSDIYNVEPGMLVVASTDATAANIKANYYLVSDPDFDAGTFTLTRQGSSDLGSDVATGDYIYVRGDIGRGLPGIPAFITSSAGVTTTLLGYTRKGKQFDTGWRQAYLGTIESTIKKLFSKMGRFVNRDKARYSVCLSYGDWLKLEEELAGRVYRDPVGEQKFGTDSLLVRVPGEGTISVIALPILRDGRGYIIDWSSWTLYTGGGLPEPIDEDGMTWRQMGSGTVAGTTNTAEANASTDYLNGDGVKMLLRAWFHCLCTSPISNGTFLTA